jgi:hypothetical protein
MWAKI